MPYDLPGFPQSKKKGKKKKKKVKVKAHKRGAKAKQFSLGDDSKHVFL